MYLGLDIGTSSTKGVVIDDAGRVVGTAAQVHDFDRSRPGWSEQDPSVWWAAACVVMKTLGGELGSHEIKAVGLSGQMHGSVFLDQAALDGGGSRVIEAIRPALMWNDQRTAAECQEITERAGGVGRLVEMVGNAALTGFTLPKVMWLRRNEPENFSRLAGLCLPKDFVRLGLTGRLATDVGDAAGTLLFDVTKRRWHDEMVRLMELDAGILPEVLESGAVAGEVTEWASRECGLLPGTPVVTGSGDNQCGGVGAGVVSAGRVAMTLGTSGVVFAHADEPVKDVDAKTPGRLHTMCSATGTSAQPGAWAITGCMLSAAGSLEWARNAMAPGVSFEVLMREAAAVPAGSEGLLFLPYLTGERCPHPDPEARGGWIGLTRSHSRGHMIRAVVEGVSMGMAQVFDLVAGLGLQIDEIRLGGGGAKSVLWRQVLSDVLERAVTSMETEEGPAHGAALLAAVAGGAFTSIEEACAAAVKVGVMTEPGPQASAYRDCRPIFDSAYPRLAETMHALSRVAHRS